MKKETFVNKYGPRFEEKFVVCLVKDKDFASQCIDAFDESFIDADYLKTVVKILFKYHNKYKTFPTIQNLELLVTQIKDDTIKILATDFMVKTKVENDFDLQYIKDESVQFLKNRAMINAVMESVDLIQKEQYDQIKKVIDTALITCVSREIGHDYFESFSERTDISTRNPIPTGWKEIDDRLSAHSDGGGLADGELGSIIASTGSGKSMALVHIGAQALKLKKTVVHYTLELKDTDVGLRYDACLTKYPISKVTTLYKKEVEEKLKNYEGCKLIIKEYPTKSASVSTIEKHLEQLRRMRIFPDLIIIDYADLLRMESSNATYEAQGHNYEQLRRLAGEWKVPIWTASQGNREAANAKLVDVVHIAESYNKACVSDVIISLSRTNKDKVLDTGRICLLKNRVGQDGLVFPAKINYTNVTIEVEPPSSVDDIDRSDYEETKNNTGDLWKKLKQELHV